MKGLFQIIGSACIERSVELQFKLEVVSRESGPRD